MNSERDYAVAKEHKITGEDKAVLLITAVVTLGVFLAILSFSSCTVINHRKTKEAEMLKAKEGYQECVVKTRNATYVVWRKDTPALVTWDKKDD